MKKWLWLSLALIVPYFVIAQDAKYTRKSVTYLDALYLSSPSAHNLSGNQVAYLLEAVEKKLDLPRFDKNPIPGESKIFQAFVYRANMEDSLDLEKISSLLNETLVPEIESIIDEYAEARARGLVTESSSAGFVATKAKELGITAENLEKIYNSAYIYIPFVNGFSTKIETDKKGRSTIEYHLKGGILWFKVIFKDNKTSVIPVIKSSTTSMGVARLDKSFKVDGKKVAGDEFAFISAAKNFARNLESITRAYPAFSLVFPIAEVEGSRVKAAMGRKEGIHVDDKFIVGEIAEDEEGKTVFQSNGFVEIVKVADNKKDPNALSLAKGVITGDWARGMLLKEHARLALDVYFLTGFFPSKLTAKYGSVLLNKVSPVLGGGAGAAYHIGRYVGIPQLMGLVEMRYAIGTAKTDDGNKQMTVFSLVGGLAKRFRFHRLGVVGEILGGLGTVNVQKAPIATILGILPYDVYYRFQGFEAGAGIEYVVTPDWLVAVHYRYAVNSQSNTWYFSDDDQELYGPKIDCSGSSLQLEVNWSPPSLPFDPIDWVRGNLGI